MRLTSVMAALALGVLAGVGPAAAQDTAQAADDVEIPADEAPQSAARRPDRALDEIVVSAQKREESLQEVPIAVSAIGEADLKTRGIQSSFDIQYQIPNFSYSSVNGSALLSIRGVGLEVITGVGEPAVAMHIDGVYQPRVVTGTVGTYDLERIEVLRGPQGTLYGRNANAGVINFITKAPADEFEVSGHVGYGNFKNLKVDGGASGPITDWLSFRASALYEDMDGWIDNLSNGKTLMDRRTKGGRIALRATPVDDVIVDVIFYKQRNDMAGPLQQPVTAPIFPSTLGANYSLEPWEENLDLEPWEQVDLWAATLVIDWEISDRFSLKSVTGRTSSKLKQFYDGDSTDADFIYTYRYDDSDALSEEVTLSGRFFDESEWIGMDVLVGGFYLQEDVFQGIPVEFPKGLVPLPPPLVTNLLNPLVNILFPNLTLQAISLPLFLQQQHDQKINVLAGFVDAAIHIKDWATIYGGVRVSRDKKEVTQTKTFLIGDNCTNRFDEASWTSVSPKIGIRSTFLEGIMVYAQYQEGFKAGGFNLSGCGDRFEPELIESYEVGAKTSWFDGLLTVNATGFTYTYTDLQVFQIRNFAGNIDNAPEAEINGAELEISSSPLDMLRVDVAVSWLDATYVEFSAVDGLDLANVAGLVNANLANPEDVSGNHLNRAPEWTVFFGLEYGVPVGEGGKWGTITARGEMFWTAEFFFRPFERDFDRQEAYTIYNAFLTWISADGRYSVRGWGKNLTNEAYLNAAYSSDVTLQQLGNYAPPRTYGFDLRVAF